MVVIASGQIKRERKIKMFKVEVIADNSGIYVGNGKTFEHVAEAEDYAIDLMSRWTLVRTWRVVNEGGKVFRQG